ncbi:acyl-CoA dehydrogenase family protein [Piscinibacter koreensis]|uniref:Acyl-CoA dehydrogenase family protein n=1 Tax=Piscinibacter koreensis TaxID=2742824 RepID=A0A7Y6TY78_9BURK|nr:acyl-CoA dehydrogenase family protein [Schlegelella koreensis]NUZ07953.1 acyl-CoA dehydrogenase family protein [Schlegelella koreensis]
MTEREETLELLVHAVRRFTREVLLPAETEVEETEQIPDRVIEGLKELGLFGMTIPESYGGLGLSMFEEASLVFEVAYAQPAFRSYFGTTNGVGTLGIINFGSEEQRQRYLPRLATGDMMASFCLTEPDAGSDAASLSTRAVRDGDHWVINGTKRFITNAIHAGVFTVFARTGLKEAGAGGISAFLVDRDTPGLTVAKPYRKMGFAGSHESDVIFENCRVPASALLGAEGTGFKNAMRSLDHARLHMAAVATGMCQRLLDEGLRYATERRQFGQPIANFQLIQAMLADSQAEAFAARAMVEKAARAKDAGLKTTKEAACCKYYATEAAGRIADRMLQIHGGNGYIKEYAIERLYRDARLLRIYEGSSQIMQIITAREMVREATN